jgi:hypothetical protein
LPDSGGNSSSRPSYLQQEPTSPLGILKRALHRRPRGHSELLP